MNSTGLKAGEEMDTVTWRRTAMSNRAEKDAVRWCHVTHQVFAEGISS